MLDLNSFKVIAPAEQFVQLLVDRASGAAKVPGKGRHICCVQFLLRARTHGPGVQKVELPQKLVTFLLGPASSSSWRNAPKCRDTKLCVTTARSLNVLISKL